MSKLSHLQKLRQEIISTGVSQHDINSLVSLYRDYLPEKLDFYITEFTKTRSDINKHKALVFIDTLIESVSKDNIKRNLTTLTSDIIKLYAFINNLKDLAQSIPLDSEKIEAGDKGYYFKFYNEEKEIDDLKNHTISDVLTRYKDTVISISDNDKNVKNLIIKYNELQNKSSQLFEDFGALFLRIKHINELINNLTYTYTNLKDTLPNLIHKSDSEIESIYSNNSEYLTAINEKATLIAIEVIMRLLSK